MKIYIETVFLDNFLLDTLLLWLTSRFLVRRRFFRITAAGAAGGLYACAALVLPFLSAFTVKLLFGFLLCAFCFGRSAPRASLYFFALSALLGGLMMLFAEPLSFRIALIACLLLIILAELIGRAGFAPCRAVTAEAVFADKTYVFSAEYDSGCTVKDHLGRGVILIDRKFAEREGFLNRAGKTRSFPVTTAAGTSLLPGIRPQRVSFSAGGKRFSADCWILIADNIELNGSPAIFGRGLIIETEVHSCSRFTEYTSFFSRLFKKTAAAISTAVNRSRRPSPRKKRPPSC